MWRIFRIYGIDTMNVNVRNGRVIKRQMYNISTMNVALESPWNPRWAPLMYKLTTRTTRRAASL